MRYLPPTPNPLVWPILAVCAIVTWCAGLWLGFSRPSTEFFTVLWFACGLLGVALIGHAVFKMPAVDPKPSLFSGTLPGKTRLVNALQFCRGKLRCPERRQ